MEKMVECLSCGKKIKITKKNIYQDELGQFVECNFCGATTDLIDDYLSKEEIQQMLNRETVTYFSFIRTMVLKTLLEKENVKIRKEDFDNIVNDIFINGDDLTIEINKKINVAFEKYIDMFEIDNVKIDIALLETIYIKYLVISYQNKLGVDINTVLKKYNDMSDDTKRYVLDTFYKDISNKKIIVKIFKDKKDMLSYIMCEGKSTQQILDNIVLLAEEGLNLEKNNVYQIANIYVYMKEGVI